MSLSLVLFEKSVNFGSTVMSVMNILNSCLKFSEFPSFQIFAEQNNEKMSFLLTKKCP
jgi:hypothetical protein